MSDIVTPHSKSALVCILHTLTTHQLVQHSQNNHLLIRKRSSVDFDKGQTAFPFLSIRLFPAFLVSSGFGTLHLLFIGLLLQNESTATKPIPASPLSGFFLLFNIFSTYSDMYENLCY